MTQINCTQTAATVNGSSENATASGDTFHSDSIVILSCLALLAIPIIVINFGVMFLVSKKKTLRTPANICLASLACSDLLTGLCVIPLVIICTLFKEISWPCLSMEFINRMLSISAILHLLVIALERYVVIVCLVRLDNLLSCKRYVAIVSAVWFIPLCASLIQLSWLDWKDGKPVLNGVSQAEIIYDLVCFVGFLCLPLLIIAISYSRVFSVLHRHTKDINKQASLFVSDSRSPKYKLKEKRATIIYTCMIVVYVVAWFPYFLLVLSKDLGGGKMVVKIPLWVEYASMFTRFSSPLVNPLLYTFFKQDFQRVIGAIRRGGIVVKVKFTSASSPMISTKQLRISRLRHSSNTADLG